MRAVRDALEEATRRIGWADDCLLTAQNKIETFKPGIDVMASYKNLLADVKAEIELARKELK